MTLALRATLSLAAAGLLFVGVAGCSGPRYNVTPFLDSYAHNHEQDKNRYLRTIDHNTRSAWDDLAKLLLLDRPLRLVEYPVP